MGYLKRLLHWTKVLEANFMLFQDQYEAGPAVAQF
jgi:hypothetical protein